MVYALKLIEVPEGTGTDLVGKIIKLKDLPSTMGRGKDASIVVRHRKLSRLHCRFFISNDRLCVKDLGSTNGTLVNGALIAGMQSLQVGDSISVGGVVFQVGHFVLPAETLPNEKPVSVVTVERSPEPRFKPPSRPAGIVNETATDQLAPIPFKVPDLEPETVEWRPTQIQEPVSQPPHSPIINTSAMPVKNDAIELDGLPKVQPVSSVQIESSFIDKSNEVDLQALPDFAEIKPEVDAAEIDLEPFG